jgi:DNA-binding SARP family transcriptional activator
MDVDSTGTQLNVNGERGERPVFRLFGPLTIENGAHSLGPRDLGGTRPKQVLEILLAARGHRVPSDRLAELLWPADRPQHVAGSLQTFISVLRRHLAEPDQARALVVTEPEAYRFATELVALDLDCFDELLERSARQPTHLARSSLEQALELVRGDVLEDEPYTTWALDLRGSYQGRVLGARLDAADAALAELDYGPALAHAEAASAFDRFSERAQRSQMMALYALGRANEALDRYRSFRKQLDEELGLEPSAETRALEAAVIRQEDLHSLLPRPLRPVQGNAGTRRLPLLGRASEVEAVARAVRNGRNGPLALVQIEGEAGFGKTRLLDELVAAFDGVRIGCADCSRVERHLPYVPIATALRDALDDVELAASHLPALGQVFPELTFRTPERHFDEVEVLEAIVALIAEEAPLVLLLDDIQWADERTLAALRYLRRRRGTLRGAFVTTMLTTETQAEDLTRELEPTTRVRLEPLSAGDLAAFGITGLYESTGGVPRFVSEALASGRPAAPSPTLAEALLAQCRAEGAWACRVLVAAALLEQPFEPEPLAELFATDATTLAEELERLCKQRILRIDGLGFRFRYDLVRRVLVDTVSPARRRLVGQRLKAIGAISRPSIAGTLH